MDQAVRLTQLVKKGGCAAKISATVLRDILSKIELPPKSANVIVDGSMFDDAAIYDLKNGTSLVQTLDFFTPIVDSPRVFGRIAAANALSDVYAMGGRPATCMAILTFPQATLDPDVVSEILFGACEIIAESGASLVGGHSVDDDTIKFGLSVTGFVPTARVWTNAGARSGDVLILTKALGTGTLSAGLKSGAYTEQQLEPALKSMTQLNRVIDCLDDRLAGEVHAATDITGFGLAGHAMQLAKASGVTLRLNVRALPLLPGVLQSLQAKHLTRAHRANLDYTAPSIEISRLSEEQRLCIVDPQTSGGLLLAVTPDVAERMFGVLHANFPATAVVGCVESAGRSYVIFE